ncbi:efflux RND transporter periplasmic adaptor subunit [Myroides odoratimimus]|uniref:efflux RND transporter periplasmic adaptor subunit n=1 Tax=Myroides odoratimimus TaxID=76832 RepID=UPI002577FB2C|nr:efflux RND transporter periplasmic adaptor subunit [Myroides odoratimimus]MDM1494803.1 efflux RND transporter periplasmic adaptor subunit [Myroides odoratimimus]MDM1511218.1 efflux RND transporter periplasmic adaptor subunit [Myroides odoratimimus]
MLSKYINTKYFVLGLALASITLFTQCKTEPKEEDPISTTDEDTTTVHLTDAQMKNTTIETGSLTERKIATTLKLNGKIDVPPQNLISITNPLGGYLKSTKLLPGMHIKKGELIATMEDPQYIQLQQNYLIAKDKYEFAKLDYNRQKDLNASQASSDKVMQIAQAEMNNQRITMNALAQQLSLINISPASLTYTNISRTINIYSPINGFVSNVFVNVGKYVTPSDVMFELINPTDIHLNLKVYEKDLDKLEVGQRVVSYTNGAPDKKYEGEIILISMDVNTDGVSEVHCHFEAFDKKLVPGMYMNADIDTHAAVSQALPEESVVYFEKQNYVFIETAKQTYEMTPVKIGPKEDGYVQIINADQLANQKIVTKGAYTLLMKLKNTEEEE